MRRPSYHSYGDEKLVSYQKNDKRTFFKFNRTHLKIILLAVLGHAFQVGVRVDQTLPPLRYLPRHQVGQVKARVDRQGLHVKIRTEPLYFQAFTDSINVLFQIYEKMDTSVFN